MFNPYSGPPKVHIPQTACPPSRRKRVPGFLYPPPGGKIDCVALDNVIFGCDSHWWQGGALPCVGIDNHCVCCEKGWAPRWYGYLPSLWLASRQKRLVCITEGAYRECPALQHQDGQLRGVAFRLFRMNQSKSGPVKCTVEPGRHPEPLPPSWSVREALETLWRLEGLLESIHNGKLLVAVPGGPGDPKQQQPGGANDEAKA